jgi:hypothetical protein
VRNSWGTGWGDGGYGWLPYKYVEDGLAVDFWSLFSAAYVDRASSSRTLARLWLGRDVGAARASAVVRRLAPRRGLSITPIFRFGSEQCRVTVSCTTSRRESSGIEAIGRLGGRRAVTSVRRKGVGTAWQKSAQIGGRRAV